MRPGVCALNGTEIWHTLERAQHPLVERNILRNSHCRRSHGYFWGDHRVLLAWRDGRHNMYKQGTRAPPSCHSIGTRIRSMRSRNVQMSTHMTRREAVPLTSWSSALTSNFSEVSTRSVKNTTGDRDFFPKSSHSYP